MSDIKRYELYGWDYDLYNPLERRAVDWYLRWLREVGGPVLEIACGRGPLVAALAGAGAEVTGLDLSETMLSMARERVAALPPEVRDRVTLVKGDMADFDLGRTFRLALIADNAFRELPTREELLRCLRVIRRHVEPGGTFLLTEARFNESLYADGVRHWPWTKPSPDPLTGAMVRRRVRVEWEPEHRRLRGVMFYESTAPDGTVTVKECPYVAPVLTPDEYREMLREAGFDPRLFVGYEDRPDDGAEPILCFVCGG